jgi:hypothetical protein
MINQDVLINLFNCNNEKFSLRIHFPGIPNDVEIVGRSRDSYLCRECHYRHERLRLAWYKGLDDGSKERTGIPWEFPTGLDN